MEDPTSYRVVMAGEQNSLTTHGEQMKKQTSNRRKNYRKKILGRP